MEKFFLVKMRLYSKLGKQMTCLVFGADTKGLFGYSKDIYSAAETTVCVYLIDYYLPFLYEKRYK